MANVKKAYKPKTKAVEATPSPAVSVEAKITNLFIEGLKSGHVAWQKPWITLTIGNIVSDNVYTGRNAFLAALHAEMYGVQPNYATVLGAATKLGYKAKGKGWVDKNGNDVPLPIKKGAKGLHLCRYAPKETVLKDKEGKAVLDKDGNTKKVKFLVMVSFCVFSIDHLVWDLSKYIPKVADHLPMEQGETITKGYIGCPPIKNGGNRACYSPTYDSITMPTMGQFESPEAYYRTLFHELVHSTGHADRLNRQGVANFDSFGSHQYSFEELVAEIGSGMLCEFTGIPMNVENSQAYLNGWIAKLELEPKWILKAVGEAKKAVELIIGHKLDAATPEAEETETDSE